MEEQKIGFELAILAKSKGFEVKCKYWYDQVGGLNPRKGPSGAMFYENVGYAYTQSLLQKWLRDVHNIFVEVAKHTNMRYWVDINTIESGELIWNSLNDLNGNDLYFDTYEEALEAGLLEALNLIK